MSEKHCSLHFRQTDQYFHNRCKNLPRILSSPVRCPRPTTRAPLVELTVQLVLQALVLGQRLKHVDVCVNMMELAESIVRHAPAQTQFYIEGIRRRLQVHSSMQQGGKKGRGQADLSLKLFWNECRCGKQRILH